jgi:hypothetical protein
MKAIRSHLDRERQKETERGRRTFSLPPMKMVLQRSRMRSGAPFMTSKWRGSAPSSLSWTDTWYLLVELKGISHTFLLRLRIESTSPSASSMHLSRAASDASPATSFFRIGTPSCPPLNSARLHSVAIFASALNPGLVRSVRAQTSIYTYTNTTIFIHHNSNSFAVSHVPR